MHFVCLSESLHSELLDLIRYFYIDTARNLQQKFKRSFMGRTVMCLIAAGWLLGWTNAMAQVKVQGLLTDQRTELPVPSAEVRIFDALNDELLFETTSDPEGQFYVPLSEPGSLLVRVRKDRYAPLSYEWQVEETSGPLVLSLVSTQSLTTRTKATTKVTTRRSLVMATDLKDPPQRMSHDKEAKRQQRVAEAIGLVPAARSRPSLMSLPADFSGTKISIGSGLAALPDSAPLFRGHKKVWSVEKPEGFSYFIGEFDSYHDALLYLDDKLLQRYPEATVVEFVDGKRY